jgi:hypothetical protein
MRIEIKWQPLQLEEVFIVYSGVLVSKNSTIYVMGIIKEKI